MSLRLRDLLIAFSKAVGEATRAAEQHFQKQLNDDYFNDDGTPKHKVIELQQADGSWKSVQLPLISFVPKQNLQIQEVSLGFKARLVGSHFSKEDLASHSNLELTLGDDSTLGGTPVYIRASLSGSSKAADRVQISLIDSSQVDRPPVDRKTIERELRMIAIDLVGGFSRPNGPALLVCSPAQVYSEETKEQSWRYSESSSDDSAVSQATVRAFEEANKQPGDFDETCFSPQSPFSVNVIEWPNGNDLNSVSTVEISQVAERYPDFFRIMELSEFGWAADGSECILYIGWLSARGSGRGRYLAFRQHGSLYSCSVLPLAPQWNK